MKTSGFTDSQITAILIHTARGQPKDYRIDTALKLGFEVQWNGYAMLYIAVPLHLKRKGLPRTVLSIQSKNEVMLTAPLGRGVQAASLSAQFLGRKSSTRFTRRRLKSLYQIYAIESGRNKCAAPYTRCSLISTL